MDYINIVKDRISSKSKAQAKADASDTGSGAVRPDTNQKPSASARSACASKPSEKPATGLVPKKSYASAKENKKEEKKMSHLKANFYRIELNRTVWEIPEKYQNLTPVGVGAYGQVW